jgi:hypothetical protein
VSFGRHDLVVRAGQLRTIGLEESLFPLYATLTLDTRW